jgi:hypothetical protein
MISEQGYSRRSRSTAATVAQQSLLPVEGVKTKSPGIATPGPQTESTGARFRIGLL